MYIDDLSADFDVLLSDNLRRTVKLMLAINKGAEVLSLKWLTESGQAKKLLPTQEFVLRDEEMERRLNFSMAEVLGKVRRERSGIFEGRKFYLSKGVVPVFKEMKVQHKIKEGAHRIWRGRGGREGIQEGAQCV